MADREKVASGLKHCLHYKGSCLDCPYDGPNCQNDVLDDALAMLKEQEPRVLTLDEAVDGTQVYYVEFQYHLDRGWVKCDFDRMYVDGEVAMLFLRNKTFYQQKEYYGQLWRLWNRRPTDKQMKAVKWDG